MRDLRALAVKDRSGIAQLFGIDDILIAAGISAGASLLGGAKASSASKSAAAASQYATDQQTQLQREALQTAQQNTAVPRTAGNLATTELASRFGLIPTGSSLGGGNIYAAGQSAPSSGAGNVYSSNVPYSSSTPQAGSLDWGAYLQAHPDVQATWDSTAKNNPVYGGDITKWAQDQYQQWGQAAGWAPPPTVTADQASAAKPVTDVQLSSAAQVPIYTRPTAQQAPAAYVPNVYEAPTYDRPTYDKTLDVSYGSYEASPEAMAAQYDIDKQSGAAGSALAASGALKSGAAQKRLQEIGQDNKVKYYTNFRDYNTGQYNTDRARFDNIYNYDTALKANLQQSYDALNNNNNQFSAGLARQDYQFAQNRADNVFNLDRAYGTDLALGNRAYETSRYDTQTGNLFNLANLGQGAAASYTGAAQTSANNQGNALFSNAANQGNAALTSAAQTNQLIGTGLSALGYALGNRSNTTSASTVRTGNIFGPQA